MTVYLLEAYNTDSRYPDDVRYREYTTSKRRAEAFAKIPKIQFTDSGHGIAFSAREHKGARKPTRTELSSYVMSNMVKAIKPKKETKSKVVMIRMSEGMYKRASKKATSKGMNLQEYIRHLVVKDLESASYWNE